MKRQIENFNIDFDKMTYKEIRNIMREKSLKGFEYEMKLFIIDEISIDYKKDILMNINLDNLINYLLVDGIVIYKKIYDENNRLIQYKQFDIMEIISEENFNIDDIKIDKREYLCLKYPIIDSNISLIGQMISNQITLTDSEHLNDFMIEYIIKKIKIYISEVIKEEEYEKNKYIIN